MTDITNIYKKYQAQTFPSPSLLHVKSASGSYIRDYDDKEYLDFVAGVSACSIGHCNKQVTTACLLYTSPSPRDGLLSRMPSSA